MGLRLFWEVSEGKLFKFTKVLVLPLPRNRFKHIAGKIMPAEAPLGIGFEGCSEENSQQKEILLRDLFARRVLDKSKRRFLAGSRLLLDERTEWAAELFRKITIRDETQADAFFALALCCLDPQEQLQAIERTLLLRREYTRLSKDAGVAFCAVFSGCDGRDIRVVNDFLGLELLAAEIFQNHGKLEDAGRLLEYSQHADSDFFRFSRGELLLKQQRYEEAIDVLRRLKTNPHFVSPAFYLMGLSLEKLGYHSTAVQVYRGCLRNEKISKRLEIAIRLQLVALLERENKMKLAQQERELLVALEQPLQEQ
ncbi:MAG: hypothetical protein KGZ54_03215 [Dethiobacter sp.]|nr:hypothetical protein [Dethiobacter sp.]MBS3901022.1 hypothetical protein [Dethiobacter sp.]MBS3990432.1 hypothetical protein [Dethiobacter sp.]